MGDRSFLCFVGGVLAGALVLGGAGCGRQLVGVAKPADLLAWEPQATDPTARITAVSSTADWIYVGFSDGEMFSRPNADGASWASYATGEAGGCGAPIPPDTVTAFAISVAGLPADEQQTFVAFAGPPGSSKIWHAPPDRPCWATSLLDEDVYGLSASPFSGLDVVAVSPADLWATNKDDFTSFSDWTAGVFPIDFDGTVQALASGASPSGATRAWLGDDAGNVYYSDDVDSATASASASITWTPLPNPGFPRRPVVAIATRPDHPQTIWVTFAGLYGDSLWSSTDNGATWHNPRGGELGSVFQTAGPDGAAEADAQAPVGSSKASFGVVSPVPGLPAAYVTALVPDWKGVPVATAFWTLEGTGDWWRQ